MVKEKTLSSQLIYDGRAVRLRVDTVETPSGRETTREIVEHADCVAIIAIDDSDNVLLVNQFRKSVDKELLEIPAGGIEAGEDPMAAGMGMDIPGQEDQGPTSPKEVGRIYELRKIHSRLVSIESYLSSSTDPKLLKLRNYVSQAIELFDTLVSNITLYKDKTDEIIVMFYSFLKTVYTILSEYYNKKKKMDED